MATESPTTYLLTWNPKLFPWENLDAQVAEVAERGGALGWWSTGSVKSVPIGSRVFVIRLASDPRGIVASGYTTGEVAQQEHFLQDRRAAGDLMNRVPIRFDALSTTPLIRRAELEGKGLAGYKWDSQMSGVRIPPEVARDLELLWRERIEGVKRGETPPAVLPADVERWRPLLEAAEGDPEYVERYRLRDQRRMEVNPALKNLAESFIGGQASLVDFKERFDSKTRVEWEVLGLRGPAGAMFLNQVAKNVPDHSVAERVMRAAVEVPANAEDARAKIDSVIRLIDDLQASGVVPSNALRSANAPFFLSGCWHAQQPETWPTFFQSARKALQDDGLLDRNLRGGDGYVAFVDVFRSLARALGVSFLTLEHLCDRLQKEDDEIVGVGGDTDGRRQGSERPRVWLVAPGARAHMFDEFYSEGVIGIGWAGIGDLAQYRDAASVKAALQAHRGTDVSPVQDAYACYQFVHEMQIGDLVFAKKGRREIVGYGVITGDYRYEPTRGEYPNLRSINWKKRGSWIPREKALVTKTLTDVGKYPQLVADLKQAVGLGATGESEDPVVPETRALYTIEHATADLFSSEGQIEEAVELLRYKKNLVIQGPPGVGKTFFAKHLAYLLMGEQDKERVTQVQFHQSYSYEDFVQGYRPNARGQFERVDGAFLRFCDLALQDPGQEYVLIIDEINRGNLSKIFGELMLLIEADKRSAKWQTELTYGREGEAGFHVPENLHIIGTMNTADRSLAMVDYALRRRFVFVDLGPALSSPGFRARLKDVGVSDSLATRILARLDRLNATIKDDRTLGSGFCIGHSYFCQKPADLDEHEWYRRIVRTELAPLLREYWFDDRARADSEEHRLLEP